MLQSVYASDAIADYDGVIRIGTATKAGTFYRVTEKFCHLANEINTTYCVPVTTNGSLHNINLLLSGKLDFALVKSDIALSLAKSGVGAHSQEELSGIKVIATLHNMPVTIIGRQHHGDYLTPKELTNSILNIGLEGSGERAITTEILGAMEIDTNAVSVSMYDSKSAVEAFCNGQTDIVVELIAHPALIYNELLNRCEGKILSLKPNFISRVSEHNPYIYPAAIYDGFYKTDVEKYETYAVRAILIANYNLGPSLERHVAELFKRNFLSLKAQLPEWLDMMPADLNIDTPVKFLKANK